MQAVAAVLRILDLERSPSDLTEPLPKETVSEDPLARGKCSTAVLKRIDPPLLLPLSG